MCRFKAVFPTLLWRRMLRGCSTLYPVLWIFTALHWNWFQMSSFYGLSNSLAFSWIYIAHPNWCWLITCVDQHGCDLWYIKLHVVVVLEYMYLHSVLVVLTMSCLHVFCKSFGCFDLVLFTCCLERVLVVLTKLEWDSTRLPAWLLTAPSLVQ